MMTIKIQSLRYKRNIFLKMSNLHLNVYESIQHTFETQAILYHIVYRHEHSQCFAIKETIAKLI